MRQHYPNDANDAVWGLLKASLSLGYETGGRPPIHLKREHFNAVIYVLRTGCSWRH